MNSCIFLGLPGVPNPAYRTNRGKPAWAVYNRQTHRSWETRSVVSLFIRE